MFRCSLWDSMAGLVKTAFGVVAVIIVSGALESGSAEGAGLVGVDEARGVPLVKSPATVIIGNPLIADVSVQNGNLMVVMGKNYGTTNIIALDGAGEEIINLPLNVTSSGQFEVSLHKGGARMTYNCAPMCETELNVGDDGDHFGVILKEVAGKKGLSEGSTDAGGEGE